MQMDSKTLGVLEWPKVIERLAAEAATMAGKDRCQAIEFHTDLEGVSHALRLTTEADELIRITGGFPLGGIRDIRQALRRVEQGADLDGPDLLAIADTMDAARRVKAFMGEHAEAVPAFAELAVPVTPLPKLVSEIKRCFDLSGEVSDDASPSLHAIRLRIRQAQSGIREKLQRMLNTHAQHLQESLITVRGDRFVLPVRSDAKSQVPGLVHDQSASGSTLYIEPMAVVELNNSLSKARLDERDEIARILERLTQLVLADLEEIHWTLDALAEIDFTVAKARLSRKLDARAPRLSRDGFTRLYSARHPLLAAQEAEGGHKVVAIDIEVGGQVPILLITGPNTGGKTVSLKTLGLVTLMAQAGLHAPVAEGSVVGLVKSIYADIGDEQSLAQSLSTFSGHMTNIIRILGRADRKSLVLLDEIGAGTDPQEGAVLARAIIEEFLRRGTRLVATTHYGELKLMAYETPGVRNASVEFDAASLRPTYRLLMGVPGQSNAVLIAGRLGLPAEIVKRSEELLQSSKDDSARIIGELETEQHQAAIARREAEAALAEARRLREQYETKLGRWNETLHDMREKARQELNQELSAAREEITGVIRELQGSKSSASAQKARDRVDRLAAAKAKAKAAKEPSVREVSLGEKVFLPRLNQIGVVQTVPDANGEVILQVGIMRVTAKVSELAPAKEAPKSTSKPLAKIKVAGPSRASAPTSTREASLECDLRGMLAHEAIGEAETFLDTALGHDIKTVTLIHGGGTGALRKAIRDYLRESPYVASFRPGSQGEGGDGVTIVTLG